MRTIIPKDAKLIPEKAECVFRGQIFDVYQWRQEMYDSSSETFEMLKRPDTIKVIAIKDNKIVILNQKQPDSEQSFYDLPGGRHDYEDESELDAVKRETLEETGMTFKNWRLIKVEQPYAKMDWFVYLFLATDFENQQDQKLDSGEKIKVELKTLIELKELVNRPDAQHLPKELIDSCQSIENLLNIPEYKN